MIRPRPDGAGTSGRPQVNGCAISRSAFLSLVVTAGAGGLLAPRGAIALAASDLARVRHILRELSYDHPHIWPPRQYHLETVPSPQGVPFRSLVYTNPKSHERRIDAMRVRIHGQDRWVRGIYYAASKYPRLGGIVFDAVYDPNNFLEHPSIDPNGKKLDKPGRRCGFSDPHNGPNILYDNLLLALAHQQGLTTGQLMQRLAGTDYVLSGARLPNVQLYAAVNGKTVLVPKLATQAPSFLTRSAPRTIDLKEPFSISLTSGPYRREGVPRNIPRVNLLAVGYDDSVREGYYVGRQRGLHLVTFPTRDFYILWSTASISRGLFLDLEILANMTGTFVDPVGYVPHGGLVRQNNFISRLIDRTGDHYVAGSTVLPPGAFSLEKPGQLVVHSSLISALLPL